MREKTQVACGELRGECCTHFLPEKFTPLLNSHQISSHSRKKQMGAGYEPAISQEKSLFSSLRDIRGMMGTDQEVRLKRSIDLMYRSRF